MIAAGRTRHVGGLDPEQAGPEYSQTGIDVDPRRWTASGAVFAMSGGAGGCRFAGFPGVER